MARKKKAPKKKKRAPRRARRVAVAKAKRAQGGVSGKGEAGTVTTMDSPRPLLAETNPTNWSPTLPEPPARRANLPIDQAQVLGPLPPAPDQDTDAAGEDSLAVQFLGSAEDPVLLHETLMARVAVLEAALQELRSPGPAGIGHNRPPPDEPAFVPVSSSDLDEIDHLISLLKEQPPLPTAVPAQVVAQSRVVGQIGAKIGELADIFAKEAVKAAGHEIGKRLVQIPFWLGVAAGIAAVSEGLQHWIAALPQH
jgi:hypothetical protein